MNLRSRLSRIKVTFEDQWLTAPSSSYHPTFNADSDYINRGLTALSEQGNTAVVPLFTNEDIHRIRDTMDKIISGVSDVSKVEFLERVQYYRFCNRCMLTQALFGLGHIQTCLL